MNLRLLAARTINDVTNGRSLAECLEPRLMNLSTTRDRAFVQAVCYGVCRHYDKLDFILSRLLKKPMNSEDSDVHSLLLVGLYQLTDMRVPSHAAVSETVNAVEKLNKPWAKGLMNAVLREYLRQEETLATEIEHDEEAHYAHPRWWISAVKKAWPAQWQDVLLASNVHPPFALRVNQSKLTRDEYLSKLIDPASAIPETTHGVVLEQAVSVENLPGFIEGEVSVQDGAAQLATDLLMLAPNQRVLDACAAPGGKLNHILEQGLEGLTCIAVEKDKKRIESIRDNLKRLNQEAEVLCADAANLEAWWDDQPFDRILLDAPCSATGVVRRHPDIKLLREPQDIQPLANEQLRLLKALWPTLAADGVLLYVTCSIFPEENVEVIQKFMASQPDAEEIKIDADWGVPCKLGRQILPGSHGLDGFYYARLKRRIS
ncbi:MAG: 16S rRNA (cytosine(967)-C(5))-methyltransferase RsmB [Gammaproteobacteria bacterium]